MNAYKFDHHCSRSTLLLIPKHTLGSPSHLYLLAHIPSASMYRCHDWNTSNMHKSPELIVDAYDHFPVTDDWRIVLASKSPRSSPDEKCSFLLQRTASPTDESIE